MIFGVPGSEVGPKLLWYELCLLSGDGLREEAFWLCAAPASSTASSCSCGYILGIGGTIELLWFEKINGVGIATDDFLEGDIAGNPDNRPGTQDHALWRLASRSDRGATGETFSAIIVFSILAHRQNSHETWSCSS